MTKYIIIFIMCIYYLLCVFIMCIYVYFMYIMCIYYVYLIIYNFKYINIYIMCITISYLSSYALIAPCYKCKINVIILSLYMTKFTYLAIFHALT